MLKTVEAEVGENGQVRLREPLTLQGWHRAVLTVLEPIQPTENENDLPKPSQDWRAHVGVLKNSPNFNQDPVAIQKALRDEWD